MRLNIPALGGGEHIGKSVIMALLCLLSLSKGNACGDFSLPTAHFEGVSEKGSVSHWEQIGTLDLGEIKIPLIIGFQTYLPYTSPELGAGWTLPLFDSNIVQRDEGTFDMVQPDGSWGLFRRDATSPNILHGSGKMLAEINGDTITVNSTCGSGWKMVFNQGKLISLSKGNHNLSIIRDPLGRAIGLKDGAARVLTLEQDQATGLAKSIEMGEKKYELSYDAKPRVEKVNGVNLVGGVDQSLHKITLSDGKSETFDFAVTDKLLPNLKITDTEGKERMIVWGTDGKILQDGEWAYTIKPQADPDARFAAIERKRADGKSEFWNRDEAKGEEVTQGLDGVKEIKTWFTTGVLAGKLRSKEEVKNGATKKLYTAVYDEKAQRIRAVFPDGVVKQYQFSPDGKQESTIIEKDGKQIADSKFDEKGRRTLVHTENGRLEENKYNDSRQQQLIYVDGKLLAEVYSDPNGKWTKRIVYDAKTGIRKFSRWKEFNATGKLVLERLTDEAGKAPDFVKKFEYDVSGRLVKEFNSKIGTFIVEQGSDGKLIRKLLSPSIDQMVPNKS